jgi:hypothetical protein
MLNFKCVANTNGFHHNLQFHKGLCLIHAGNITNNGTKEEVVDFLAWFKTLPFKHKIFIGGKNDYFLAEASLHEINKILPLGVQYLSNQIIEIEGLKIYGMPNSFNLFNVAFGIKNTTNWRGVLRKIPDNLDVLITNQSPLGILDNECGCPELTKAILKLKPKIHIFNHVYPGNSNLKIEDNLSITII